MGKARFRTVVTLGVALQFAITSPVLAGGDEFVGGLVGGVIGGIIGSQIGNNRGPAPRQHRPSRPRVKAAPQVSAATREENRRIQVSLNAIDCNAGTPDGAFGPRTREAIRCFQGMMNYRVTGQLTGEERALLISFYDRVNSPGGGGSGVVPVVGGGAAALIDTLRNRPPASTDLVPVAPVPTIVPTTTPIAVAVASAPALPDEFSFCATTSAGPAVALPGVVVPQAVAYVDDVPVVGLCSLRDKLSADAASGLKALGASQMEASAQCRGLAGPLSAAVGQIGSAPPDMVIASAYDAVGGMVTDVDAAVGSARLCAGIGYQENDLVMVEAASLFGAAVGDPSLIEAIGWDLAFGLGRAKDPAAGATWLREAADQMVEVDASLLLMPEADRSDNLKAVAAVLAPAVRTTTAQPAAGFALPGVGAPAAAKP